MTLWQTWRQAFRASPKRARIYEGARLEEIARVETLAEAWGRVRANKGGPGGDGVAIEDLATDIELSLEDLAKRLQAETYRPGKLRRALIHKASGGKRSLSIPAVIDRVAQTAAMPVLEPEMDARMSETSLAYRVGRGPPLAIAAVESAFAEGIVWTVDADIQSYFDSIWHRQLTTDLAIWIDDERILRLILRWLRGGDSCSGFPQPVRRAMGKAGFVAPVPEPIAEASNHAHLMSKSLSPGTRRVSASA